MAFTTEFTQYVETVQGEKSPPSRSVKLGRLKTQIAASRAFIRLLAHREERPNSASSRLLQKHDPALVVLDGSRSIGDAMGGDPAKGGLGLRREEYSREFFVSRENAALVIRCLLREMSEAAIAGLAGCETAEEFEQLVQALPTNEELAERTGILM